MVTHGMAIRLDHRKIGIENELKRVAAGSMPSRRYFLEPRQSLGSSEKAASSMAG